MAHPGATGTDPLTYARILGLLGDAGAAPALAAALDTGAWDERILPVRMAEYSHLPTPVDGLVLALGGLGLLARRTRR